MKSIREKSSSADRLGLAALALVVLALLPAYMLALQTPFRLVDDLGDWAYTRLFQPGGAAEMFHSGEWSLQSPRFRPFFGLSNALTWTLFGGKAWLHHLLRLLLKLGAFGMAWATLCLAFKPRQPSRLRLGLAFACLFLLFPNNPEARLGPQETWSMLWLSALNLLFFREFLSGAEAGAGTSSRRWGFMALFCAYILTKEANFLVAQAMLAVALLSFVGAGRGLPWGAWARFWPEGLASLFVGYRIVLAAGLASDISGDHASLGGLGSKMLWVLGSAFPLGKGFPVEQILGGLSFAIPLGLAWRGARRSGNSAALWLSALIAAEAFASLLSAAVSNHLDLRYASVFCMLSAQSMALGFMAWADSGPGPAGARRSAIALGLSLLWAASNYHNFIYQFALQRETGRFEENLERHFEAYASQHRLSLDLADGDEPATKLLIYLTRFQAFMGRPALAVGTGLARDCSPILTRRPGVLPGWALKESFSLDPQCLPLRVSAWISAPLQARRPGNVFSWVDGGASSFKDYSAWYLMADPSCPR